MLNAYIMSCMRTTADVSNWERVKAVSNATLATLVAWSGRGIMGRVAGDVLIPVTRAASAASTARNAVSNPATGVVVAALATAVSAWGDLPILRNTMNRLSAVNEGVVFAASSAATSAAGWLDSVRSQRTTLSLATMAMVIPRGIGRTSNVFRDAAALVVGATRGAAHVLTANKQGKGRTQMRRSRRRGLLSLGLLQQFGMPQRRVARPASH